MQVGTEYYPLFPISSMHEISDDSSAKTSVDIITFIWKIVIGNPKSS